MWGGVGGGGVLQLGSRTERGPEDETSRRVKMYAYGRTAGVGYQSLIFLRRRRRCDGAVWGEFKRTLWKNLRYDKGKISL